MSYGEEEPFGNVLENLLTHSIRYAKIATTISVTAGKNQVVIFVREGKLKTYSLKRKSFSNIILLKQLFN